MNYKSNAIKITIVGLVADVFLFVIKFVSGILFLSSALVADSVHSLSDIVSDIMIVTGIKIASKPKTGKYPYGLGKIESLITIIVSLILILISAELIKNAYSKISTGILEKTEPIALLAAFISIFTKEFLFRYTYRIGKKINSLSLIANAYHHRSDAVTSLAVLFGITFVLLGYPIFDPIASIIVSFFILYSAYEISKDAVVELLDINLTKTGFLEKIESISNSIDGISNVDDIRIRKYGHNYTIDLTMIVDNNISIENSVNLKEKLIYDIMKTIPNIDLINISTEINGERHIDYIKEETLIDKIKKFIERYKEIKGVHNIVIERYKDKVFLYLDFEVDGDVTVKYSHSICEKVRVVLINELKFNEVRFHIDPYIVKNKQRY